VVELDGEIHNKQKQYDIGREGEMEEYGIRVLRFKNHEVLEDLEGVVGRIKESLEIGKEI
jgi:very-short-patch-repair endonuclease